MTRLETGRQFDRQLKRLSRKYRSLSSDLRTLAGELLANPLLGDPLGNHCYKIRLAISSKGQGRSGGARVITHVIVARLQADPTRVVLLAIYDKSELASLSREEIDELVRQIEP